jgi:glycerol dehydrogenase-like iron-containing ADH family enzyme
MPISFPLCSADENDCGRVWRYGSQIYGPRYWKLAHLLLDDAYDEAIACQADQALRQCMAHAITIRAASPGGITALMESLLTSGHCMVAVKSSRPAAGAEHSLAHFWEITHRPDHAPEALHGERTGVAAVLISRLYEALRHLSQEVVRRLDHFTIPDPQRRWRRFRRHTRGRKPGDYEQKFP